MRFSTEDQRAAIEQMWPDIGGYCDRLGLTRERLLTGSNGVPLDGSRVMYARAVALLTRKELASEAGVGVDLIGKVENEVRDPSAAALLRLCEAMSCRPADLIRDLDASGAGAEPRASAAS
jgi:transcriptional regulator with XRE-family HTH domain